MPHSISTTHSNEQKIIQDGRRNLPSILFAKGGTNIYIYPENLKAKAMLWLWPLRDVAIIGTGFILSVPVKASCQPAAPFGQQGQKNRKQHKKDQNSSNHKICQRHISLFKISRPGRIACDKLFIFRRSLILDAHNEPGNQGRSCQR